MNCGILKFLVSLVLLSGLAQSQPPMAAELTRAQTLVKDGKSDEAEAVLKALIARDKTYYPAYDILYGIYAKATRIAEAEGVLTQKIAANPSDGTLLVNLATHYFLARKVTEMKAVLNRLVSDPKKYPDAFQLAGDFLFRIKDFDNAERTYAAGEVANPEKHTVFTKRLIEVKVAQNKLPEALALTEALLKENPKDPDSIAMRAAIHLQGDNPEQIDKAIVDLQFASSQMPENFVLRFNLGRALLKKNRVEEAKAQFQESIKLRLDYVPPRFALAQIQLTQGDNVAALASGRDILGLQPNDVSAQMIVASAVTAMGQVGPAIAILENILKEHPELNDAKYQLAFNYFQQKRPADAEKLFSELYKSNPPDLRGMMGLTEIYMSQGKFDTALAMLKKELDLHPGQTNLKVAYGNVAVRKGDYLEAIKVYQDLVKLNPQDGQTYVRMGIAYRQSGDIKQAESNLRRAVELLPDNANASFELAMLLHTQGDPVKARPFYENVLKLQPTNEIVLNNLAFIVAEEGKDLDYALRLAQRAMAKNPNDANIGDTVGWIYIKKNLPDSAIPIFNEIISKSAGQPNSSVYLYHLAVAHAQKGDKAAANKALDEAMKANPNESSRKDIQALQKKLL